jgi:L-fucose isomerase-like protein
MWPECEVRFRRQGQQTGPLVLCALECALNDAIQRPVTAKCGTDDLKAKLSELIGQR